ncbi:MAG: Hsp20/alpha crystallin family protein [Phycisphaerae bacterium]|nr:Hsp20/alpha crystallin family protein [Phycisphaerae bacterium]
MRCSTHSCYPSAASRAFAFRAYGARDAEPSANTSNAPVSLTLPVDVYQENGAFVIKASLPGFQKEQVAISMRGTSGASVLTITASRGTATPGTAAAPASSAGPAAEQTERVWFRRERRTASWERAIRMPEGVTDEGITAVLKDGVLTVTVPQPQPKKPDAVSININ